MLYRPPRVQPRAVRARDRPGWAGARMFSEPGKLAGSAARRDAASPPATSCCTGWARPTRSRSSASRGDVAAPGAVIEQTVLAQAVLPAAALQALQRSSRTSSPRSRAIRWCWSWRRSRVITPRCSATPSARCSATTRSTSPTGSTRATSRADRGAVHARRLRRLHPRVHPPHRRRAPARHLGLPAGRAGAGRDRADGGGRRAPAAQPDHDGRPDRRPPQPDPGQRVRHQPPAELVREQPASPGARSLPGARPPRLSRVPAARRLHRDEPGPAHRARTGISTSTWSRATSSDAEDHRRFYDEYNAVLDMPAEYYLDCIRVVFQQHLLPRGLWHVAGERVAPEAITRSALLTIEGELDDISGIGQTRAAHDLCLGIPARAQAPPHGHGRRPLRHLQRPALARVGLSAAARVHRHGRDRLGDAVRAALIRPRRSGIFGRRAVRAIAISLRTPSAHRSR